MPILQKTDINLMLNRNIAVMPALKKLVKQSRDILFFLVLAIFFCCIYYDDKF